MRKGSHGAAFMLGVCHERGEGVPRDFAKAASYYQLCADQGNTEAQLICARWFEIGKGVRVDLREAAHYCRLSAAQGNPVARLIVCLEEGRESGQDMALLKSMADNGDPWAQMTYARCLEAGRGVAVDLVEAEHYFEAAFANKAPEAQWMRGIQIFNRAKCGTDQGEALRMFRLAAGAACGIAEFQMGNCLQEGLGVPRNTPEAKRWIKSAGEKGCALGDLAGWILADDDERNDGQSQTMD
jgi:TPR repeat protein